MLHPWSANQERSLSDPRPVDPGENEGKPVFRLRRSHEGLGLFLGLCVGLFSGVAFLSGGAALVLALLTVVAGWLLGNASTYDVCSDRRCRAPLYRDATYCPGCHGDIRWVIHRADEHHAALAEAKEEDAVRGSSKQPAREAPRLRAGS